MGLTIHYDLKSDADNPMRARQLIERLRQAAFDLPMAEVGELVAFSGTACNANVGHEGVTRWLITQAHCMVDLGEAGYHMVSPTRFFAFSAWPGEECEVANFGLALYPEMIETRDGTLPTGVSGWRWHSFCKTQYSSNPGVGGIANFIRCHLAVIRLLDHAKALGILESVNDEGGFWEKRDVKALVETVGQWNAQLAGIVGQLKDQFRGLTIAPITQFPDFEHLEAEGRKGDEDDSPN